MGALPTCPKLSAAMRACIDCCWGSSSVMVHIPYGYNFMNENALERRTCLNVASKSTVSKGRGVL